MSNIKPDYYEDKAENICVRHYATVYDLLKRTDFTFGNIFKYLVRHNAKNGEEDLRKASEYLDMALAPDNYVYFKDIIESDSYQLLMNTATFNLIMDSFSEEEQSLLNNKGADLALSLLIIKYFTFDNPNSLSYKKSLSYKDIKQVFISIADNQFRLLLDDNSDIPKGDIYKSFEDFALSGDKELQRLVLLWIKEYLKYSKLPYSIIHQVGISYDKDGSLYFIDKEEKDFYKKPETKEEEDIKEEDEEDLDDPTMKIIKAIVEMMK